MWVRFCVAFVHACGVGREPRTFKSSTPAWEKLERLFEWVVKDPKLRNYFIQRYTEHFLRAQEIPDCDCDDCE